LDLDVDLDRLDNPIRFPVLPDVAGLEHSREVIQTLMKSGEVELHRGHPSRENLTKGDLIL
jgi:hypothetical protein